MPSANEGPGLSPYHRYSQRGSAKISSVSNSDIPRHSFHLRCGAERNAVTEHDFTSASAGKFSDCLFHSCQGGSAGLNGAASSSSPSLSSIHNTDKAPYSSSNSLLNPGSARSGNTARNSSHEPPYLSAPRLRNDRKRLVHQFLNFEEEGQSKHDAQVSLASQHSLIYENSRGESLSQIVLKDLKEIPTCQDSNLDLVRSQSKAKSTALSCQPIMSEISKFDSSLKDLILSISSKDNEMSRSFNDLDVLQHNIQETRAIIQSIQSQVKENDLSRLKGSFEADSDTSFIKRFSAAISAYSDSLTSFEERIANCKAELAAQKATVHKLETTIKLNEMLEDSNTNKCTIDRIREYRGIITDAVGLLFLVLVIITLKRYLAGRNSSSTHKLHVPEH